MPVAKTRATAQVGDLLWLHDPINLRSRDSLAPVRKIGAMYLYVGAGDDPRRWEGFEIETGYGKSDRGFTGSHNASGADERAVQSFSERRREVMDAIVDCTSLAAARKVLEALGLPELPDFSVPTE